MKCFIVMFPRGTFEKYTHALASRGQARPMTLRNEAFQNTATFRKFDFLNFFIFFWIEMRHLLQRRAIFSF